MTLKSMTGFGRAEGALGTRRWHWEVRSVNGRGLDIRFRAPPGFEGMEPRWREAIGKRVVRGSLNVSLNLAQEARGTEVRLNEATLAQVLRAAERVREMAGGEPPRVEALLGIKGVLETAEPEEGISEELQAALTETLERALAGLVQARGAEGARLATVLQDQLATIEAQVAIAAASPARSVDAIKKRLAEQVAKLIDASTALDPARLHQEAILAATRADIEEELKRLGAQGTQAEVEFQPGSSFYDAAAAKLYVSSTDLRPVDQHRYSIPVAGAHGLLLEQPKRVVLDGIAARGFEKAVMQTWHTESCTWGIVLREAKDCVIRHCTTFLNGGGILTRSENEGGNLIEDCVAYGNISPHGFESGGVVAVAVCNDTLRRCTAYKGGVGVRLYGGEGYGLIEKSLGWGNVLDLGIKGGTMKDISDVRDCVALSYLPSHREVVRSIIGFKNINQDDVKAGTDTSIR